MSGTFDAALVARGNCLCCAAERVLRERGVYSARYRSLWTAVRRIWRLLGSIVPPKESKGHEK